MMRVYSGGNVFYLNFEHQVLPGADVRHPPSYEELLDVMEAVGIDVIHGYSHAAVERIKGAFDAVSNGTELASHCTLCKVSRAEVRDDELVIGKSYTAKGDNFCRRTGRWWALTRGLEYIEECGGTGADFFNAYFERAGGQEAELAEYLEWYQEDYLQKHPRLFDEIAA